MSQQDIEDRLPRLLRAAADGQPDAPRLFDGVASRVQRRQHRRLTAAAGAVAVVVAAAVAVPVAVSSLRTTEQRVLTAPAAPTTPALSAQPARCPTRGSVLSRPQADAPDTQLFPEGATALVVCSWTGSHAGGRDVYRLAAVHQVPAGQVAADVAALNTLTLQSLFTLCLRPYPLSLSLVARYPDGRTFTVQYQRPCSAFLTNGSFSADATADQISALTSGRPVTPVPSSVLTARLVPPSGGWPGGRPPAPLAVMVTQGRHYISDLRPRPDGSYRARVRAGVYTLQAAVGTKALRFCTGRATVTAGRDTTVDLTCPAG